MERAILHSDLNCFYASVEMMLNPSLRGKAIAVCGATEDRHGIILAKSELAKKAGVKTGMVNWEAQRICKDLILIHPQYDQYLKYSKLVHEIYYRYTDLVEPFGMDECWLDITGSRRLFGDPMSIAEDIRRTVREELGLTVSIGVSFNKIFAKLGSDMKKPDAVTEITRDNFRDKVWPLPVSDLLYVGAATANKLASFGVKTIGGLASLEPKLLKSWFGINGLALWSFANGTDRSRVMHKDFVSPVKSIGHGVTCTADLSTEEDVWRVILELSQDVGRRLRVHELAAKGVQITIRDSGLAFTQYQRQLDVPTQSPWEIASAARKLFNDKHGISQPVRAVTVRGINLQPKAQPIQFTFFMDPVRLERQEHLEDAVEAIRQRFGRRSVISASLLGDLKIPVDRRDLVIMPGMMYM